MILVLLGTNPYPFNRLLTAVVSYAQDSDVKIVAQTGNTPIQDRIDCRPFMSHAELIGLIDEAEVVICQGGYGSLSDCLARGAKTVAVPRSMRKKECVDNQLELVQAFAEEGLIIPVYEIEELPKAIEMAKKMNVKEVDVSTLPQHIANTINSMLTSNQY